MNIRAGAVRRGLATWAADLEHFAFPQLCPGCGVHAPRERLLCDACRALIPRLAFALCARCLARATEPVGCNRHPGHAVWAAWVYDERAALIVQALKYGERPDLARALAGELARALPPASRPDLVLPVPLHPARRRERGYNQAELLAQALSGALGVACIEGVLERVRATRPQARLGPRSRRDNVAGAFRVRRPEWLKERNIVLVDDVITTGATFEAALDALRAAGARAAGVALAWAQ